MWSICQGARAGANWNRKFVDSPLERAGFELPVPGCEAAPNRDPAEFCLIRLMNGEKSPHGWGLNRRRSGPRPAGKSAKQLNILRQFVGRVPRRC
jgi:hypothetical protein